MTTQTKPSRINSKFWALLGAGAVSVAALTGGLAYAADQAGNPLGLNGHRAEVQQFLKAPHTLSAAIAAAEQASQGQAVAAEFDEDNGRAYYEVKLVTGDKLVEAKVDASTGKVLQTKDKGLLSKRKASDRVTPAQLGAPLSELLAKAEQASGEKVMAIDYEYKDGKPVGIEVELAKADGSTSNFLLDPASGTLTPYND